VIAVRLALLTVALAACAWFALGVRSVNDQNQVNALLNAHDHLTPAQAQAATATLNQARVLDPDEDLNILRAQVKFHSGDVAGAVRVARGVVSDEPRYADGWLVLEVLSDRIDPALNRLAQARLAELVPAVSAGT
jgi:hypothetical protein